MHFLAQLIKKTCMEHANRPAIYYQTQWITYAELWQQANHLAGFIRTLTGERVVILSERNHFALIAIVACILADKTFVPLSHHVPLLKNLSLCKRIQPTCILYSKLNTLQQLPTIPCFDIQTLLQQPVTNHVHSNFINHIACLLFTSGTTGEPKIVPISHINLLAYIHNFLSRYAFSKQDRFIQLTEINFDPILHDLLICWAVGGCLYLYPEHFLAGISRFVAKHNITVWSSVPSLLNLPAQNNLLMPGTLTSLRWTILGGEVLRYELCQQWHTIAPNSHIVNCYGPTETTIAIMTHLLSITEINRWPKTGICPIGLPFNDIHIRLNNGECCVAGPQVTEGYLNKSCASQFVWQEGNLWYHTGDYLRVNADGVYEFAGRLDSQVKRGGYRIELLEIEQHLQKVAQTLSIAVISKVATHGVKILAFISHSPLKKKEINCLLQQTLPAYLLPDDIILLPELPRMPNGKIAYQLLKHYDNDIIKL